jgi:hypothetical protein
MSQRLFCTLCETSIDSDDQKFFTDATCYHRECADEHDIRYPNLEPELEFTVPQE